MLKTTLQEEIGKRITLKVKDLMLTGAAVPIGRVDQSIGDILVELSDKRCGCILIADDNHHLLGVFTDGDLRRTLQKVGEKIFATPLKEVMNPNPTVIGPEILAWEAMKEMESNPKRRISMLPVVAENGKILGLLHLHDIIQHGL